MSSTSTDKSVPRRRDLSREGASRASGYLLLARRAGRDEGGYTLTEYIVVMSVLLIFMSLVTPFLFSQLRAVLRTERQVDLQQNARAALRSMVRELRQAQELYATVDKPTGTYEISFGVDLDGDGVINSYTDPSLPLEQVTYYLNGDTLYRGRTIGDAVPVAVNVDGLTFTLFGSDLRLDRNGDGVVTEDELNINGDVWIRDDDDEDSDGDGEEDEKGTRGDTKRSKKGDTEEGEPPVQTGTPKWEADELLSAARVDIELALAVGAESQSYRAVAWLRNRGA